jgi:hypothetical protein
MPLPRHAAAARRSGAAFMLLLPARAGDAVLLPPLTLFIFADTP